MSTSLRGVIVDCHKAQLKTLVPNGEVWRTRAEPPSNTRPCFTLYDDSETVQTLTVHPAPRPQQRELQLVVVGWCLYDVGDPELAEQRMDALALSIEQTITPRAGTDDLQLQGIEKLYDDVEPRSSSVTLRYLIKYRTTERNPVA
ncbi:hypothetical protein ACQE3E_06650 [Methylomonas sp. MED-D]|uniref:hypothetical protein n=1 Tax=Methylomonas sp. MED-D TaxID=3418768 RepID=UPI003D009EE7